MNRFTTAITVIGDQTHIDQLLSDIFERDVEEWDAPWAIPEYCECNLPVYYNEDLYTCTCQVLKVEVWGELKMQHKRAGDEIRAEVQRNGPRSAGIHLHSNVEKAMHELIRQLSEKYDGLWIHYRESDEYAYQYRSQIYAGVELYTIEGLCFDERCEDPYGRVVKIVLDDAVVPEIRKYVDIQSDIQEMLCDLDICPSNE